MVDFPACACKLFLLLPVPAHSFLSPIPAVYSSEHRGWLVHFVIAKDPQQAREHGRRIEKTLRSKSIADPSIRNHYLNDSQLFAAFAVTRGDITIRDEDEYILLGALEATYRKKKVSTNIVMPRPLVNK